LNDDNIAQIDYVASNKANLTAKSGVKTRAAETIFETMPCLHRPKHNPGTWVEPAREIMLEPYRGSPRFSRPAERARRARSYLRNKYAHPHRKHKSIDHASVMRSLSHKFFSNPNLQTTKVGSRLDSFMSKRAGSVGTSLNISAPRIRPRRSPHQGANAINGGDLAQTSTGKLLRIAAGNYLLRWSN
jgi:hypothetical protein